MIGDFTTKPLQGALFRKFRDQIMGVTPARDPGPGKTDSNVGKIKNKPKKGKAKRLVPPGKTEAPKECVERRTRDHSKVKHGNPIQNALLSKSKAPSRQGAHHQSTYIHDAHYLI
jgi:hypothetical protein